MKIVFVFWRKKCVWLQIEQARRLCQQKNPNCFQNPLPVCHNVAPICPGTFTEGGWGGVGGSAMGGTATGKGTCVLCTVLSELYC